MTATGNKRFERKRLVTVPWNTGIFYMLFIAISILLLLSGCNENSVQSSNTDTQALQSSVTDIPNEDAQKNNMKGEVVPFENIIRIPSEVTEDFSGYQVCKPDYRVVEEISLNTAIYDVRYKAPYLVYSHEDGYSDAVTVYDVTKRTKCVFPSRTSLRRFIRFVSFDDTSYSYLTTAEHEPYTWQYFKFDTLHGVSTTKTYDMKKVISEEDREFPTYKSDVEEEGNLLSWIEETEVSGSTDRLLHICILNEETPELVHTIKLNRGVNTLTPLTIKNQCISYVDYHPDSEKWYIRTYDVFKGEHSPDSCDFEMNAKPEGQPMFDRSLLAWMEERNGEPTLYAYDIQKKEKYLIDTGITSPYLEYPSLFYVRDGKLFCFDYQENRKHTLFEDEHEKVISGGGNAMRPYCLTKGEKKSNLYLLHTMPPSMQDIPDMKWVKNNEGILELERESSFVRTGMDNCTVIYNGLEQPGLFVHDMGWPLADVCKVIRADIEIRQSKNVLGADIPEEFSVTHGNTSLTFTGEAMPNAFGDGGASYSCREFPTLQAIYVKRNIFVDLPDLLDALQISWIVEQSGNAFVIKDDMPYTDIKPIIKTEDTDIDGDGKNDAVGLFLTGNSDVILKTDEEVVSVFSVNHERQIFGDARDRYQCNLFVEGKIILVGVTYTFTNKYGSTAWLYCYRYESGKLEHIWSSEEILSQSIIIEDYNEDSNCLKVKVGSLSKEILLRESEEKEFINYTEYLKKTDINEIEMEFILTPDYEYRDYDGDSREELITRTVVVFGASSFQRNYYSVYEISAEGLRLIDSYFQK